ncbi:hypothetical protein, partial [Pseudomonas sp.]|uniref:hypothetical protein n=1 Tax=Pseudomonas sp. TaxID=306 RepID=UPI002E33906C
MGAARRAAPDSLWLRVAVWPNGAADVHPSVCRLLIDIHFGLAHRLDALVGLPTDYHVLDPD